MRVPSFSTDKFLHVLDSISDCISVYDADLKLVYANRGFVELHGLPSGILGKTWWELRDAGHFCASAVPEAFDTKSSKSVEFVNKRGRHLLGMANAVLNEQNQVVYVISVTLDITYLNTVRHKIVEEKFALLRGDNADRLKAGIIYASPKMKEVIDLCEKISRTDLPVLILGETGVGKSHLAEYIHSLSDRSNGIFNVVNCSSIPPSLFESEFFGYEKGAFTGADRTKPGLFESANHGTLFLDEIGELPMFMQAKMLRVFQEKKIKRVGGVKEISVDVRIISATNKNILSLIKKNKFRSDLYHRINGYTIDIPPLREHKEDIKILINFFMNMLNIKYSCVKTLSKQLITKLENYRYPGNIRELQYIIERLFVVCPDSVITPQYISQNVLNEPYNVEEEIVPLREAVEETERKILIAAKRKYKTTRAMAEALGISHVTVAEKIKKYGI